MKLTPIFIGLLLITNKNGGEVLNSEKIALNLPVKNVELVEKSSFDTLATKNFSELSIQENIKLSKLEVVKSPKKPISFSPNSCEEMYAAAMSACYALAWNPPAFAVCAAAASAAYAACLAAR